MSTDEDHALPQAKTSYPDKTIKWDTFPPKRGMHYLHALEKTKGNPSLVYFKPSGRNRVAYRRYEGHVNSNLNFQSGKYTFQAIFHN